MSDVPARPDPSTIFQLATGYWASATLLAANELGLFAPLATGDKTAAQIAGVISADDRATGILLDACCGLGLLQKRGEIFAPTPTAADIQQVRAAGKFQKLNDAARHADSAFVHAEHEGASLLRVVTEMLRGINRRLAGADRFRQLAPRGELVAAPTQSAAEIPRTAGGQEFGGSGCE